MSNVLRTFHRMAASSWLVCIGIAWGNVGIDVRGEDPCVQEWSAIVSHGVAGVSDTVHALAVHDDGAGLALYAGGAFVTAGGTTVNRVARWNGVDWTPLTGMSGTGTNLVVFALASFNDGSGPALYVGGPFTMAGGLPIVGFARWNGTNWSESPGINGIGLNGGVHAMVAFDDGAGPALFVAGQFTTADGVTVNRVAKWNGTDWSPLTGPNGVGVSHGVEALAVYDDGTGAALYAGGHFGSAGGVTANFIAKWDGTEWSPLVGPNGVGTNSTVHALAVYDDGAGPALYVGGVFSAAGGETVNQIAKWNGIAWSTLSGPAGVGMNAPVRALHVFDDGSGQALYAGGSFSSAGGVSVMRVAKWDGAGWSALSGPNDVGVNSHARAFVVYDNALNDGPSLYTGGDFTTAGGVTVDRIARWNGCHSIGPCPGDANGDGVVDFADFAAVLAAYGACDGDPNYNPDADLDGNGCVNFDDFSAVLANYGNVCN